MNKKTIGTVLMMLLLATPLFAQNNPDRKKVEGVAAVVGDYLILESDIDKAYIDLNQQEVDTKNITRCQMLGKLMEDKLYAHQAVQDSIKLTDAEVREQVNQRIEYLIAQLGGDIKKLLEFYRKDDEQSMRDELFNILKLNQLAQRMKQQIVKDVEVTPEEVRNFFNAIPAEERPHFGTELEIAQIVVNPVAPKSSVQKVIDQLNEIKEDVEKNGMSFATKAILYSQDRATGGQELTFNRNSAFDKAFKDVAFTLQEGEISKPFESSFGWHIIQMVKIRGKEVSVRHILIMPDIPDEALNEAKEKIAKIRQRIIDKELTFDEAARNFSDEKETRNDGGQLINPEDLSSRFELTRIEPSLYARISDLKDNEVSVPFLDEDRTGKKSYRIYKITNRIDEHQADFTKDYVKIQDLALKEKQLKAVTKWMKEHIEKTYIAIKGEYRNCKFENNWLKK
ncbi:peptidylprolyl isomerase [Capnocytophaga sp. oral taxon 878]|uniref:peptidylprolyl isomerase n=1 Tax=Capnocytophaga sp. oral taxon 878 TaxID=1316596 RepID=UPI000D02A89A|nr:peptidylprolyl isomerase [Capnocytophaga sp. oral taxon 878]AVM51433.1 peptidylprolyl isomerase [Capnocytophaga sp. oral taxon 878]